MLNSLKKQNFLLFIVMASFSGAVSAEEAPVIQESDYTLDMLTITGTRERAYRSTVAPSTNKSDTSIKETPFSIQTVTRELMEDRGVITLGEALRSVPGVTPQVGWGGSNDRFRLRGFPTNANLKNGFRRSAFVPVDELINIEQIEVLKGPASALYGRFEPGGVVNLVTKKPLDIAQTEIDFTAGSEDFYRATFDTTGPLSDNVSYRVTGAFQDSGSFRDNLDTESQFISPVLEWRISPKTTLNAEMELGHRQGGFDRGFGSDPIFLTVPIENSYAEPDANIETKSVLGSVVVDHEFDNGWKLHTGIQGSWARSDGLWYAYGFGAPVDYTDPSNPMVNRSKRRNVDKQVDATVMAELSNTFNTGQVEHRVLIGSDYNHDYWDFDGYADVSPFGFPVNIPISLYNPQYGAVSGPLTHFDSSKYSSHTIGVYLQNEIKFSEQWRLLLGLRYDRSKNKGYAEYLPIDDALRRYDDAFSPRVGVTWTPVEEISVYASWAESFLTEPFSGMLRSGTLPAPSKGEQLETGVKLSLLDGRLEPTVSWFDIRRENGVVSDPLDWNYSIQVGEKRSRGWEIDIPYAITPQWRLLANYTQLKAYVSEDSDSGLEGNLLENAPRRSASIWSTYDFLGQLDGLSVGLGANYVGARQANSANDFKLPSYTRWDANVAYRFGVADKYKVQLTLHNLTDRRYYDSGGSFVPTFPGAPRTLFATFGMRF
ncbi:Ferrichrome-iron receptor [Methylophaga frappieri]|uniref:Ferrichrome-iron receptor n=1 Tax=Methylophaga frappieri (strain ATCC BAA-2434 / DSM 25690 / JAM7) TaxID=754477 RepID=I1YJE5_METFJ|nr:TonB-dependent siderophore receptor [Methylophaga frappieri]AFJ03038.1 Ferrichrome-iron receptor [Methylophaga frappieri]